MCNNASLIPRENGVYELARMQGDTLRVFVCECYAFGIAEYKLESDGLRKFELEIFTLS